MCSPWDYWAGKENTPVRETDTGKTENTKCYMLEQRFYFTEGRVTSGYFESKKKWGVSTWQAHIELVFMVHRTTDWGFRDKM